MRDDGLVRDVRRMLSDPAKVAGQLGLKVHQRGGSYVLVLCPVHGEKDASCSLHKRDGSLAVKCHGCGWGGTVLHLIGAVEGLDTRREFKLVLARAAELAGFRDEAEALRGGSAPPQRARVVPVPTEEPERDYPPASEVQELWDSAIPVTDDPEATGILAVRRIDPDAVRALDAARVIRADAHPSRIPDWARFKGRLAVSASWRGSGHRMLVPVYDASGALRSLRAWLVTGDPRLPKRVPPAGHRASGLVLGSTRALGLLRGELSVSQLVVVEGEPDFLARWVTFRDEAIIGVGSGSWTDEFAARVAYGSQVILMTHLDGAGDRYATAIERSVSGRAQVFRWTHEEPAEASA